MSYAAMSWALDLPVTPAMTKFILVVMAECVNADSGTMECWPSYAYLARRTGMNTKTVESSVYRLRQERWIIDTGKRAGDTGKVVVYRLNDPNSGGVTPRPESSETTFDASATRAQMTPNLDALVTRAIPPNPTANPPKSGDQSPQKVGETTPKTGGVIGKESGRKREGTGKKGDLLIPGVSESLMADYIAVRKAKKAGPITATVIKALEREAAKAGLSVSDAVQFCCEASWQGFNAGWYSDRQSKGRSAAPRRSFKDIDYSEGVTDGIPDA